MADIFDEDYSDKPVVVDDHRVHLGDDINLIEREPTLRRIHVGFGWDLTSFNTDAVDLDVSVFLLNKDDQTREDSDFLFYNNTETLGGAVKHHGDSRTGAGEGDDESIVLDLSGIPFDVVRLVFVLSIYKGHEKSQNVSMVHNAYIRLVNADTNIELLRYELDQHIHEREEVSMIAAFLNREGPKWHFVPHAEFYDGGLAEIATRYGIIVAQAG